ncbi:MAG: DUF4962 domain-containing protein [Caldilineaceae bacterium]
MRRLAELLCQWDAKLRQETRFFRRSNRQQALPLWSALNLVSLLVIQACNGVTVQAQAPTAPDHPRLFFNTQDVMVLRKQAATTHRPIWLSIKEFVDASLNQPLPVTPPQTQVEDTFRNLGNQLIPFAFACVISGETNYCNFAKQYLLAYMAWPNWDLNDQRDLGLAHMLIGSALAYDWLYPQLTPQERTLVSQRLAYWTEKLYQASTASTYVGSWHNWWRQSYAQNHSWTNSSALGLASLALLNENPKANTWLDEATQQMQRVQSLLNGIQDGSWHEGIQYQTYGLTMALPFLVNLRRNLGIDLLPHTYLQHYTDWGLYNHLPGTYDSILAYGDFEWSWDNSYQRQNIYRFIAGEYGDQHAEWLAQQIIQADPRAGTLWSAPWYVLEFFYYKPALTPQAPANLDLTHVFPDLAAVVWRAGWQQNDLVFALKTSAYGGRYALATFGQGVYPWDKPCTACQLNAAHDHDDSNSFYLWRGGRWLAPEVVGTGAYATSLHNTLLIDGQGQYRPQDNWDNPLSLLGNEGFFAVTANSPNFAYLAANATKRYKQIDGIQDITRYVVFVRPDYLLMIDHVAAAALHQYDWVAHFGEGVAVQDDWVYGKAGNEQVLGVGVVSPQPFLPIIGNDGQPYVHIQPPAPVQNLRFINLLYPTDEQGWDTKPTAKLLTDDDQASLIQVQNHHSLQTDDLLLFYNQASSLRTVGSYQSDGQVAVVRYRDNGAISYIFMYGGTFLADITNGHGLIQNLEAKDTFEATFAEQTVTVSGKSNGAVLLYAPGIDHLIVNGRSVEFTRVGDSVRFNM